MFLRTKEDFKESFAEFTNHSSSRITRESLKKWCKRHDVSNSRIDSFISKYDLNEDKAVEYHEFVRYYIREEIQEMFSQLDADGNGKITPDEIKEVLIKGGLPASEADTGVREALEQMDVNHDGKVSYEEFARFYVQTNYSFK